MGECNGVPDPDPFVNVTPGIGSAGQGAIQVENNRRNHLPDSASVMQKIEEFVASVLIVLKAAQHRTGDGDGILFFNSSHDHAQMLRFDDNCYAFRADLVY